MATQQELIDTVYHEFVQDVNSMKIKGDEPVVQVVGKLTRSLKKICNGHGGTVMTVNGKKYTQSELQEGGKNNE